MIPQEGIAPYLPGFNDRGMRSPDRGSFRDSPDNFQLDGVWKCPSQKKREMDFVMDQLTGAFGNRSFFRLDYSYLGRSDLWANSMFPEPRDRSSVVEKYPASGRVMLTDTIFWWQKGLVWYNNGSEGPSYEAFVGDRDHLQDASLITGINEAYGDGSVEWKKIDSDDRFRIEQGFFFEHNRRIELGIGGARLYY